MSAAAYRALGRVLYVLLVPFVVPPFLIMLLGKGLDRAGGWLAERVASPYHWAFEKAEIAAYEATHGPIGNAATAALPLDEDDA